MINQNLLLTGDDGYNLSKSLRFRASASAYLSRTPASAGNRKTWTWSAWVKRGTQTEQMMFGCGVSGSDDSTYTYISFGGTNADQLYVNGYTQTWRKTTQLFRDFSAWYHIVVAVDTTQATADNRIKMYVNGSQITSFATSNNPSQNTDLSVNRNAAHSISSRNPYGADSYVDGYMADINFIDGQSLTPSSFGETDPITGVWKAKKYGGTYGTNGFYLDFKDNSSTAALGYDAAGSNDWTVNNISLTAGTTYDSMNDVPTLTSATTANYCVMNPLANGGTLSGGNLNATSGTNTIIYSTFALQTNKYYWEVTLTNSTTQQIGIADFSKTNTTNVAPGDSGKNGYIYLTNGSIYNNGSQLSSGLSTVTTGDVVGLAYDSSTNKLWIRKNNGTWFGGGDPASGTTPTVTTNSSYTYCPVLGSGGGSDAVNVANNFGQQSFTYTPPTGFVALNTFNLPEPSIKAGNAHFDATTYSGTGSSQSIVNSGGFQPSLVWLKTRNVGYGHALFDAVRGVGNGLQSNSTNAEAAWGTSTLASFNSNGFGLGADTSYLIANSSGNTFVGWQWKGNGAGSSNTAGSITSTVSANPTAGFSIATFTATGSSATIGHGLGVAPAVVIVKDRASSGNWAMYHQSLPSAAYYLYMNTTAAQGNTAQIWNSTAPTSSVFSIGTWHTADAQVAYCFAEVAGYSKFGSYTGNGSSDGTFVHLGFRPKWIMVKKSSGTENWAIIDTSRSTYNIQGADLYADLSIAEGTSGYDILSNGIKFRSSGGSWNASGATYIYMAFAENPFKYSLAR